MTTAFVLSGGGIRGPLQVGALQSLLEHGIHPDFFVGTSAGSINSGFIAAKGVDLSSIPALQEGWRKGTRDAVYPGNVFTIAWRFLTGKDGAFPSDGMAKLIRDNLPPEVTKFGQLKCPAYLATVDIGSGRVFVFGDDPDGPLALAIMASSSIPVYQDPVNYNGLQLVDGGVLAVTPASIAMDKGADVIYAVNVGRGEETLPPAHGMLNMLMRTVDTMVANTFFQDLRRADEDPKIQLHHIHITDFHDLPFNDFNHIDDMFVAGKAATDRYLDHPAPRDVRPPAARDVRQGVSVGGAREYIPPWKR